MRIWGLELEIAFLLFAITYPLVLTPQIYWNYRRYGSFSGWPAILTTGTFLYVCGLIAFTFFPLPTITPDFCERHEALRHWQFVPFRFLGDLKEQIATVGLLRTLVSHQLLVQVFNVILTIPLGFLVAYRLKKGVGTAALIGLAVSLMIEVTQGTGIFGLYPCPYRLAEVDDLIMNTTGAIAGWGLGRFLGRFLPNPHPPVTPGTGAPSIRRRASAFLLDLLILTIFSAAIEIVIALSPLHQHEARHGSFLTVIHPVLAAVLPTLILMLVVPLLRRDGATPGQVCVMLRPRAIDGHHLKRKAIITRFATRWFPFMILLFVKPALGIHAILLMEFLTVCLRPDRRSLSSVSSNLVTRIKDFRPKSN